MSREYAGIISRVNEGSLAEELELVPGDKIIAINEQPLRDIIDVSFAWMSNIIFLMYIGTFIFNILVINYRMADKIYKDEIDIQHAKLGFPFTVGYIIVLFIGIVSTVGLFNIRGIENNTPEAIKTAVLLIIGVIFATVGYFIESSNIKSNVDIERPRIKKVGVVTMVASIIIYIMMWII